MHVFDQIEKPFKNPYRPIKISTGLVNKQGKGRTACCHVSTIIQYFGQLDGNS